MKLKELLEVIPDNYEIGLANFDKGNGIIVYGTKEDAIQKFAEKEKFIKEQGDRLKCAFERGAIHV